MGRRRKGPWLRKQDSCWYTTVDRRSVRLGTSDQPYEEIERAYYALLANPKPKRDVTVAWLCDRFLADMKRSRAASTHAWYSGHLSRWKTFSSRSLRPERLSGSLVDEWLAKDYAGCSETTKNGAARCVVRVMNWAAAERLIDQSPLTGYVKPSAQSRDQHVSLDEYQLCLAHAKGSFRDLLVFLWETGCRPQEARIVEAGWLKDRVVQFPTALSKGKRRQRLLYLTETAEDLTKRLALEYPKGPLFRNSKGRPWTKDAINCAFIRLRGKTGIRKLCAYGFRHGFATRSLKNGLDSTTVGVLMGHSNPMMVAKVYQHLGADPDYLLKAMDCSSPADRYRSD